MFSRWLFVRLKAAENALHDGRLDDAVQALLDAEVRRQARGQTLVDDLAGPLLARARLHAQAGRYQAALDDLERLAQLDRAGAEAAALRQRVESELHNRHHREADRRDAYNRAAADLEAGRLASARVAIERVPDDHRREALREELDVRVMRANQLLEQARQALEAGDVPGACRFWQSACERHGRSPEVDLFTGRLAAAVRDTLESHFVAGRLDQFDTLLRGVAVLGRVDASLSVYERLAAGCRAAAGRLSTRDFGALRAELLRIRAARAAATWLTDALAALAGLLEHEERLLASPLGTLDGGNAAPLTPPPAPQPLARPGNDPLREKANAGPARLVSDPLLLLVDSCGSSLLVTRSLVRIGRAGGDRTIDIPIPAEIQAHHADVLREGDDYFLMARGPVRVNDRPVARALLRDGDRITLGDKVRLRFSKPSAKSDSAVLKMSDRCRLADDVSRVVLFVDTCLIGPSASCHLRTREGESRVVLFDRAGQLFARMANADGRPVGDPEPVQLGQTHDFGDVRFTLKTYDVREGSGAS